MPPGRGKRSTKETTDAAAVVVTPPPAHPSASREVVQNLSPTNRLEEKIELQDLNTRLAFYLDRARESQRTIEALETQIVEERENLTRELEKQRALYEKQLASSRSSLDSETEQRSSLLATIDVLERELKDMKAERDALQREPIQLRKELEKTQKQYEATQLESAQYRDQASDLQRQLEEAKLEHSRLVAQHAEDLKQLKTDRGQMLKLENKLTPLQKQLEEQAAAHKEEIDAADMRYKELLRKSKAELAKERKSWSDQLAKAKMENNAGKGHLLETEIKRIQDEYAVRVAELEQQLDDIVKRERDFATVGNGEVNDLSQQLTRLRKDNSALQARLTTVEETLLSERKEHILQLNARDADLEAARNLRYAKEQEFNKLLGEKLSLAEEIGQYRQLLDFEETRSTKRPARSPTPPSSKRRIVHASTSERRVTRSSEQLAPPTPVAYQQSSPVRTYESHPRTASDYTRTTYTELPANARIISERILPDSVRVVSQGSTPNASPSTATRTVYVDDEDGGILEGNGSGGSFGNFLSRMVRSATPSKR